MNIISKSLFIVLGIFLFVYLSLYLLFISMSPLPYSLMDFNKNGWVELNDAFWAIDIETRKIQKNNKTCLEYYSLKDGLSVYVDCDKTS